MTRRTKVQVKDIEDAEAFVYQMIKVALPTAILTPEGREELAAEGLVILQGMANKDKSQSHGTGEHDAGSKFSGYASRFMPGKIRDAWHRQEGHTLTTGAGGKREWVINRPPMSLEALVQGEGEDEQRSIAALQVDDETARSMVRNDRQDIMDLAEDLGRALDENYQAIRKTTIDVGCMLGEGVSQSQVARALGITGKEVVQAVERIIQVTPQLTASAAA